MRLSDCAVVILAAGASSRFGGDKLLAPFGGVPLAAHATRVSRDVGARQVVAVVPSSGGPRARLFAEYGADLVINHDADEGQGRSLALAIGAIDKANVVGVAVLLADMPFVGVRHLTLLAASISGAGAAFAHNGDHRSPPALFSREVFPVLRQATGDAGARNALRGRGDIVEVAMAPEDLIDIDTKADIARYAPQTEHAL
ncbi:MAG: nucleotidyltransferase family protein [Pseudomonadota bacterium]